MKSFTSKAYRNTAEANHLIFRGAACREAAVRMAKRETHAEDLTHIVTASCSIVFVGLGGMSRRIASALKLRIDIALAERY